jgi:hypothetical protein
MRWLYPSFCLGLMLLYSGIELRGWGFHPGQRSQVPLSVRQSPGGYRSFHFWHSGLHGGK